MCLLAICLWKHPRYRLVLAANRDEFLDRPTQGLNWWKDAPQILAGRDLKGGGTWLGITRSGRLAALTNFRDPTTIKDQAPSRGHLVSNFLKGTALPAAYLGHIKKIGHHYNGFNLLVGDRQALYCYSNTDHRIHHLKSGIYGLSNHLLDTPWPKIRRIKKGLSKALQTTSHIGFKTLTPLLTDSKRPPDTDLPDTGIPHAWEQYLSSIFVTAPGYGTRSSSVITIAHGGRVAFSECTYNQNCNKGPGTSESGIQKLRRRWFTLKSDF